MKKKTLGIKLAALGAATAVCMSIAVAPAFAEEINGAADVVISAESSGLDAQPRSTRDIPFFFNLNSWTTGVSDGIAKDDASSSYVFAQSLDNPCQLFVDGWKPGSDWINYTVNGRAYLNYTGEFLIKQNVYESGCRAARLGAWRSTYPTNVSGVWSADSWSKHPVING